MNDQSKIEKSWENVRGLHEFIIYFAVPSRWKSDDNMLNTNENYDVNGHKVSRSGSARSFIRGGRKNSWVRLKIEPLLSKETSTFQYC